MIDVAVEAGDLARAIGLIKGCVPTRVTQPILGHVLLRASAGRIAIFASAIDMEAEVEIGADVGRDGTVALHSGVLSEVTKKLPKAAAATIAPADGDRMRLTCGRAKFEISTADPALMPLMTVPETVPLKVKAERLKWLLDVAGPCAADNGENRWHFAGVNLSVEDGKLYGIGFDDKRAAVVEVDLEGQPQSPIPSVTIPNFAVKQITTMCREATEVELRISPRIVEVRAGKATLRTRLIDAEYKAVARGYRLKSEPLFRVKASDLAEGADRVCTMFEQMPSGVNLVAALGIVPDEGELKLIAGGTRGINEATDFVAAEAVGRFPEIGIGLRYLAAAMEVFGEKMIEVRQDAPGGNMQVTCDDIPGLRYFLSPLTRR